MQSHIGLWIWSTCLSPAGKSLVWCELLCSCTFCCTAWKRCHWLMHPPFDEGSRDNAIKSQIETQGAYAWSTCSRDRLGSEGPEVTGFNWTLHLPQRNSADRSSPACQTSNLISSLSHHFCPVHVPASLYLSHQRGKQHTHVAKCLTFLTAFFAALRPQAVTKRP